MSYSWALMLGLPILTDFLIAGREVLFFISSPIFLQTQPLKLLLYGFPKILSLLNFYDNQGGCHKKTENTKKSLVLCKA